MKVLLIVDVQRDFCPGGSLAIRGGDTIVPLINRLMKEGGYDVRVASLDWHPAQHVSFAVSHPDTKVGDVVETTYGEQRCWPIHCVAETLGAALHPDLDVASIDAIVRKGQEVGIDSYSAFFDNGRIQETQLRRILTEAAAIRGCKLEDVELHVVGLALDYCVAATALDAGSLMIPTTVLIDGCRAVDDSPDNCKRLIQRLAGAGVAVATSKEVLPQLAIDRDGHRDISINVGM